MKKINEIKETRGLVIIQEAEDGFAGFYSDPITRRTYCFVFSWGGGWEHLSISTPSRTPSWDEMCKFKDMFFEENECCVQYHPAKEDYVNQHPHCLHIWKPLECELPKPPSIYVGIKE